MARDDRPVVLGMLAAFMLPIFVQAAPRWRVLFGPLNAMRSDFPPITPDFSTPRGGFSNARDMTDPELVQQSLAVLRAYLAQAGAQTATQQIEHTPAYLQAGNGAGTGSGNGRPRMSTDEALDILGLESTATAQEIRDAYCRLEQKVDPELVQQSLAVLRAYLAHAGAQTATQQIEHTPAYLQAGNGAGTESGNGRLCMSTEEALDILGLEPTATAQEIRDAYCRLEQKVDPELGGTHYLMAKIIEARDVLLRA